MQLYVRLFALSLLFSATPAGAADDEFSTDRPDFTEATAVLAPGSVQWEGGALFSRHQSAAGSVRSFGGPFLLFRMGLMRRVELRWSTDGYGVESEYAGAARYHRSGLSDASAGVKLHLRDEHGAAPAG